MILVLTWRPAETVNILGIQGRSFPLERRVSVTGWQRGSPPPTPSFEGLLGEAMSVRSRSLGSGDILPLAEGGGRCESQLLRSPTVGRGLG